MTAVASQGSALTNDIRTAGVVMFNLNVNDKRLIPQEIPWVPEPPREEKPKHEPGQKLFKCLGVDASEILQDLVANNFVPAELKAVERRHNFRVTCVLVRRDALGTESKYLPIIQQLKLEQMLDSNLWDVTAYRNPGEGGGNYSLELGNSLQDLTSSDVLCVDEGEALTVVRRRR